MTSGAIRARPDWDTLVNRYWLVGLCALVVLAAAIRVYLFRGYVGLDDAEYARFAERFARGPLRSASYTGPAVFPLRVGIIIPTGVLFRLFGVSDWTMVAYPLLLSLAGIVLAFVCARSLFGRGAGLIAAGLLAVLPWEIDSATKLLPDLPAAVFAAAAITTLVVVERRGVTSRWRLVAAGVVAGLAFGAGWLCKESTAYLTPFCLAWLVIGVRERGRSALLVWGGVAVGALGVLFGEMAIYHHLTGDALFRVHEMERNYRQWSNSFFTEGSDAGWKPGADPRAALVRRLVVTGPAVILFSPTFAYLPLVGLVASIVALFRSDEAFLLPALWLWSLVLMFNFGSSSTTSYLPLALFHRYLHPIFFPAAVLVAGFIERAVLSREHGWRRDGTPIARWVGLAATCFVGLVAARELELSLRDRPTWLSAVRRLKDRVTPSTVIYADALSLRTFEFLNDFPSRTAWNDLRAVTSPNDLPDSSLVLVYPPGIEWLERNGGMWVSWPAPGPTERSRYLRTPFYRHPPPSWKLVWQQGDASLYRIDNPRALTLAGDARP